MPLRRRAAVLGSPIAHTLSPVLHHAAYSRLGLDWAYDVLECDEWSLPAVLAAFAAGGRHAGASLTMPLKQAALALVDELAASAQTCGAVNTVVFGPDGGTTGHDTDVAGVRYALAEIGVTGETPPKVPVVLGGGGAARAVVAALATLGVSTVTVLVRDLARGAPLVTTGERAGIAVVVEHWDVRFGAVPAADLVVSTTPVGAADDLAGSWGAGTALFDVVYSPWPTALASGAERAGAAVVGGLPMLVGQAAEAVQLMTGLPAPIEEMRRAGDRALSARS